MLPAKPSPLASDEVPITRGMLAGVRTELLQRIDQSREEARAQNQKLEGKIDAVRAELKSEIHEMRAEILEVKAGIARIEVLVEEQNARNRIVLDGITALVSRQDQIEQRVVQVEDTVRKLAAGPPAG